MTPRHFKIFKALCETLNMTHTAEKLYMTEPSVSQAVSELEKFYNVKLFDRLGKKLFLTESGSELLARATDILNRLENTEHFFKSRKEMRTVRIGASATVGCFLLPRLLRALRHYAPQIEINFVVDNTAEIEKQLLHSSLDLAIVEGRTESSLLKSEILIKDELVLVAAPRFLFSHKINSLKDLSQIPFLIRERGSGTAEQALQILSDWGITPKIAGTASSIDALRRLVLAGAGICFLPKIAIENDLKKSSLKQIQPNRKKIERNFRLIYHKSKKMEGDLLLVKTCAKAFAKESAD